MEASDEPFMEVTKTCRSRGTKAKTKSYDEDEGETWFRMMPLEKTIIIV